MGTLSLPQPPPRRGTRALVLAVLLASALPPPVGDLIETAMRNPALRNRPSAPAPRVGLLDASEAHYLERRDDLCAAAGLTCDDLRMRLDAAPGGQVGRIRVWREIEREGWR